jgi:hypothetical protein
MNLERQLEPYEENSTAGVNSVELQGSIVLYEIVLGL